MVHSEHLDENPMIPSGEFLSDFLMNVETLKRLWIWEAQGGSSLVCSWKKLKNLQCLQAQMDEKNLALDSVGAPFHLIFVNHTKIYFSNLETPIHIFLS